MEPHQKVHYLFFGLLRNIFKSISHDIFESGGFKPYYYTYILYCLYGMFYISAAKTLTQYDLSVKLNCIGFIGLAFELGVKIYSAKLGENVVVVINKIIEIYTTNAKAKSHKRLLLLKKFAFITEVVLKGGCVAYVLAGFFYIFNSFLAYYMRHEIVPIFPLYMSYIDENTYTGFILLTMLHLIFLVYGTVASAGTDFLFVTVIVNFPLLSTILTENVTELNEILRERDVDVPLVKAKLKNILLMHRDIYDFTDTMDVSFFKICLVQIGTAAISAALELFICLKIEFFPAIGLVFGFLFQIIGFCAVGAVIEICNIQMYESILLCDWFLLPLSDQMLYGFFMMNVQQAKALTIGGISPLNMETCVSILKTIYSYLMILYTFIA